MNNNRHLSGYGFAVSKLPDPHSARGETLTVWTAQLLFSQREIVDRTPVVVDEGLVLGRRPATGGVRLDDGRVSRSHAELIAFNEHLIVRDLDSQNGTFVDGQRTEQTQLEDGSLLRLGDSLVLVRRMPVSLVDPALEGPDGGSPAWRRLRVALHKAARSSAPVLLTGERGVGHPEVAETLHSLAQRGAFVAFHCAGSAGQRAEEVLFGESIGLDRGLFGAARGGSLFLDAVEQLPQPVQAKLVEHFQRGAGEAEAPSLIAATRVDLDREVREGRVLAELAAMLTGQVIPVPSVRSRREDVLVLIGSQLEGQPHKLGPDLAEALVLHDWPGNLPELRRFGDDLAAKGPGMSAMGRELVAARKDAQSEGAAHLGTEDELGPSRDELVVLLRRFGGDAQRVADELGRSKRRLLRWLMEHKLKPEDYAVDE